MSPLRKELLALRTQFAEQDAIAVQQRLMADVAQMRRLSSPWPTMVPYLTREDAEQAIRTMQESKRYVEMPPIPERMTLVSAAEPVPAEYMSVAKAVGFECPQMLQAELEAFLAEHFHVYDPDKVTSYMNALCMREFDVNGNRVRWDWRPLRQQDMDESSPWSGPYDKFVPYPVLLTVKRIDEAFGDRVQFYVTDYVSPKPDPFLAVSARGLPYYVIERWDEPTFRG